MTIKELVAELNILIEAGYGNAKATAGYPTLYVSEDGYITENPHREDSDAIKFSAKKFLKENKDQKVTEIQLHEPFYDTCSCWDFYEEDSAYEDDENFEEIEE